MCGFAGVISFSRHCRIDPARASRLARNMDADLAHRGPDGSGTFELGLEPSAPDPSPATPQALLVHRRLAVIDPVPRSDQPFLAAGGGLIAVFNGEIFNYRALRDELSPRPWRTEGDTEVLLAAYEAWGDRCAQRLEGMFAFAILDLRAQAAPRLLLARDPAGEKPLFVAVARALEGDRWSEASDSAHRIGGVAFASELAPLRRVPWIDLSLNRPALLDYLSWGYVPGARTIHCGIGKLLPGHVQIITPSGEARRRYFDSGGRHRLAGDHRWTSAVTITRELVASAVEKRLVADVPIGCLLSGGIDSSIVALHMARALEREGRRLDTFSIGFDDPRYDETAYAREVAEHLGTRHHAFHVRPEVAEILPKLARVFGEPFADSSAIPTQYLAQQTRRHVTVALGGDGGDELFGGYDRYVALRLAERARSIPLPLRRLAALAAGRLPASHPKSRGARLRRLGTTINESAGERYAGYMRLFSHPMIVRLLPPGTVAREDRGRVADRWFDAYLEGRDVVAAATALDRVTYLPGDLLVKADRCSMLHALEVRSPFMDVELLRFAGTLGEAGLLESDGVRTAKKRLLRDAFSTRLPASVFGRPKMGFAVPVGEWFRGPLRDMLHGTLFARDSMITEYFIVSSVEELLEAHLRGRADHGQRLYGLLMLELWWSEVRASMRQGSPSGAADY
jgi:asparagine synthase (glutamine-hydrolysing)